MRDKKKNTNTHNPGLAANYEMSALEKNIVAMVISKFRDDDPVDKRYFISIEEIKEKLKEFGQVFSLEDIEKATDKLITRVYSFFDEIGYNTQIRLFFSVLYEDGNDAIKIGVIPEVRRFMLEYDFTTYSGWSVLRLKSIYAKHIYQLLKEHQEARTFKISVQGLRERLNLNRESNKLNDWPAFEKTVLRTSEKEINEKTELSITYTISKTGLKYTDIEFHTVEK